MTDDEFVDNSTHSFYPNEIDDLTAFDALWDAGVFTPLYPGVPKIVIARRCPNLVPRVGHPVRMRLSRAKGWRMPVTCRSVARPTEWGNPYTLAEMAEHYPDATKAGLRTMCVSDFRGMIEGRWEREDDTVYPSIDRIVSELRGWDLACWCPTDGACHADVLLQTANPWLKPAAA